MHKKKAKSGKGLSLAPSFFLPRDPAHSAKPSKKLCTFFSPFLARFRPRLGTFLGRNRVAPGHREAPRSAPKSQNATLGNRVPAGGFSSKVTHGPARTSPRRASRARRFFPLFRGAPGAQNAPKSAPALSPGPPPEKRARFRSFFFVPRRAPGCPRSAPEAPIF